MPTEKTRPMFGRLRSRSAINCVAKTLAAILVTYPSSVVLQECGLEASEGYLWVVEGVKRVYTTIEVCFF